MDHEILREAIPEFVTDRLDSGLRREVEAHLRDCDDCAEMVATWREIATDLRDDGARIFEDHPTTEALRVYAWRSKGGATIPRHLERCATCSLEVEVWRKSRPRRLPGWVLAAAAVVFGAAILVTVVRVPAPRGTSRGPATWTGPLRLVLVGDAARGGAARPVVVTAPDDPYFLLGAQFALPADAAGESTLTVKIAEASGRTVWESELRAGDARAELESNGAVPILVPSQRFGTGEFSITIGAEGGRALLDARFDVRQIR